MKKMKRNIKKGLNLKTIKSDCLHIFASNLCIKGLGDVLERLKNNKNEINFYEVYYGVRRGIVLGENIQVYSDL